MDRSSIREEIRRRADKYLEQKRLTVNYYRIRQKHSYPLPIRKFVLWNMPLRFEDYPSIEYPWALWLSWDLEERIFALGWAGEWFKDKRAQAACIRDLDALCDWPSWRQWDKPDLALGHGARMAITAYTGWKWIGDKLRAKMRKTFARMLEADLPYIDSYFREYTTKETILAMKDPRMLLHNMPIIGMAMMSIMARIIGHPSLEKIDSQLFAVYGALLDLCKTGFTEAVAYDGYVLDFVTSWLDSLPPAERKPIMGHPCIRQFFEESLYLGAPGDPLMVAELSDVEPLHMPFHVTAHARYLRLTKDDEIVWWLSRFTPERLPALALYEMHELKAKAPKKAPAAGAQEAHYALVLRSGWEARDLAASMSCAVCDMGHIHHDNGSLVIGTQGQWLIADPGYQQYMSTSEREFALGPAAHNGPVIDGRAQSEKRCKRVALENRKGILRAELDLTACYPDLKLKRVTRTVWLCGRDLVVVGDRVFGAKKSVKYHWHGHRDAAWWWQDGTAQIVLGENVLTIRTPGKSLDETTTQRLRGSRGQLTVSSEFDAKAGFYWWVFSLGEGLEPISAKGDTLRVGSRRFSLEA